MRALVFRDLHRLCTVPDAVRNTGYVSPWGRLVLQSALADLPVEHGDQGEAYLIENVGALFGGSVGYNRVCFHEVIYRDITKNRVGSDLIDCRFTLPKSTLDMAVPVSGLICCKAGQSSSSSQEASPKIVNSYNELV